MCEIGYVGKKMSAVKKGIKIVEGRDYNTLLRSLGRRFFEQRCAGCRVFLKENRIVLFNLKGPCKRFRRGIQYNGKNKGWDCILMEEDDSIRKQDKQRMMNRIIDDNLEGCFTSMGRVLVECRRGKIGY